MRSEWFHPKSVLVTPKRLPVVASTIKLSETGCVGTSFLISAMDGVQNEATAHNQAAAPEGALRMHTNTGQVSTASANQRRWTQAVEGLEM